MRNIEMRNNIVARPAANQDELRQANALIARTHAAENGRLDTWLEAQGMGQGEFDRQLTRVAKVGGEIAGALRIQSETMQLGEARLRVGGLGWIAVESRHRHRAVGRALMRDALHYLEAHRYHVALLFGGPNVFYPFGFVTVLPDYAATVETLNVVNLEHCFKVRAAKPGDVQALVRIHNANDTRAPCSILRNSSHFKNKWKQTAEACVLTDGQGNIAAYFFAQDDGGALEVDELAVTSQASCLGVLSECAQLAAELSVGSIRFRVPPNHPFARYLTQFQCTQEIRYLRDGGGMLAFVDMDEALESMIPEWEHLLGQSAASGYRTELTLLVEGKNYRIRVNRGVIDCANSPGKNKISVSSSDLIRLFTGYDYPEDILAGCHGLLDAEARTLLYTLFPKRNPYVWPFDRF